jgi:hypothetical protein
VSCMLVVPDGPSRRVGANGLVIGRQHDCDIVAPDPSASRRHALVRVTADGAEVVPLGRGPFEVNKRRFDRAVELFDGDELVLPGVRLVVQIRAQRPDTTASSAFRIERTRGGSFGVVHTPFSIGGDKTDDLIVKRWPPHVLRLHVAQGELFVELTAGSATHNRAALEVGALAALAIGDELGYRTETFVVRGSAGNAATTAMASFANLPRRVAVEILPRGGRVVFSVGDGDRAVYLADRRLDLIVALLRPPAGYSAGEFIPDDVVRAIVWPRNEAVTRPEINMLISRCRRDLVDAGLAGPRLLERAPGGGGTRIALAPDAEVVFAG